MQQIRVTLTPFTRRRRSVPVSHVAAGLQQGLEPGEHVLLHDTVGDLHHTAVVADVGYELEDTTYRLELGTRITAAEAREWLLPPSERPNDRITTRDIVELLGALSHLRAARRRTTVQSL